jgi:hypothetical protein
LQKKDFKADVEWDVMGADFGEIASRLGC